MARLLTWPPLHVLQVQRTVGERFEEVHSGGERALRSFFGGRQGLM